MTVAQGGARAVIHADPSRVCEVEVFDRGVLRDIDTRNDLDAGTVKDERRGVNSRRGARGMRATPAIPDATATPPSPIRRFNSEFVRAWLARSRLARTVIGSEA